MAKRALKYLKGTRDYCLSFSKDQNLLEGFVDADWGGNIKDRKSYTGYIFKLCGAGISWESKKQKTVALSSTESEYMAIAEGFKEGIYLRGLVGELTGIVTKISIFNDNQSAQKLIKNPVFHKRTKHIDIKYHFIRDIVDKKLLTVEYLDTNLVYKQGY